MLLVIDPLPACAWAAATDSLSVRGCEINPLPAWTYPNRSTALPPRGSLGDFAGLTTTPLDARSCAASFVYAGSKAAFSFIRSNRDTRGQ